MDSNILFGWDGLKQRKPELYNFLFGSDLFKAALFMGAAFFAEFSVVVVVFLQMTDSLFDK